MRADKKKSLSKVAEIAINNPTLSEREIAELAWIGNWTAHRALKDLEQVGAKNEDIIQITDTDLEILKLWQNEIFKRLQDEEELQKMRTFEIAQTIEKSEKRYQIFRWDVTDDNWGLKTISKEQADLIAKLYGNT